jgi:hypothetical protein
MSALKVLGRFLKRYAPALHQGACFIVYEQVLPFVHYLGSYRWRSVSRSMYVVSVVRARLRHRGNRRSVVFLHHSYYHFYYLAKALRRRGWDAVTVSLEDPSGPNAGYYHGEDINLFSPSYAQFLKNIREFHEHAKRRFSLLHFAGDGQMSFFPQDFASDEPWDILEWKRSGRKVAYTISGCNSGVAQSSVTQWSRTDGGVSVCDKCPWQHEPAVCSDEKNLAWGRKVERFCDVIFTETSPALDYQTSAKAVREPTTMCLDPSFWRPDLPVPRRFGILRKKGELFVYHAFGNMDLRVRNGRNIKGTGAVRTAVERLQAEGLLVRLVFVTGMKNAEVRFMQVQCDVIVDQLNYGRYGATAREGMMLGKPTVCYINRNEPEPKHRLACMSELPLISATEHTVYEVLRELLFDPGKRAEIGQASRAYALKWHSADACAERYEHIYDNVMDGRIRPYPHEWRTASSTKPGTPEPSMPTVIGV